MGFDTRPLPAGAAAGVEDLVAGQPYRVLRRLGGGGMSSVYLVEHELLLKSFALKVLHPFRAKDPGLVDRVRVEAQAIAQLSHPNVVEVIDFFVAHDESPCLVLELLDGEALSAVIARAGRLPVQEAVELSSQALAGLGAAHRLGVVHRDVKPENLFVHHPPGSPRVLKVLDFGLARVLPNAAPSAPAPPVVPTNTGAVVGSLRFMSPEAGRGERVGPAGDIYSLGVVLYLMLTGRDPHVTRTMRALPPSSVAPLVAPPGLDAVVLRALEADPAHRYPSTDAFRDALLPYAALGR